MTEISDHGNAPLVTSGTISWERDGAQAEHKLLSAFLSDVAATDVIQSAISRSVAAMRLRPGDSAFDLGCGTGAALPALAGAVGAGGGVTGLDHAAGFLSEARQRAEIDGFNDRLCLIQADAHALPFPEGTFNAAHSERVLIHVADPDLVLRELRRVVRPGGWIVCVEPDLTGMRVDGEHAGSISAIVAGFCASIRHPSTGLALNRRMASAGLIDRHIQTLTEVERDYPPDVAEFFARAAAVAVERDWLSQSDAEAALMSMQKAGESGTYTSYCSMFIVAGRVPENVSQVEAS